MKNSTEVEEKDDEISKKLKQKCKEMENKKYRRKLSNQSRRANQFK
jgi:hypothetical protein